MKDRPTTPEDVAAHLAENPHLTGDCERDCQEKCAYPGMFSECDA